MFCRIRAGSIVSPSIASAMADNADPVVCMTSATIGASACQPPTDRSCSCGMLGQHRGNQSGHASGGRQRDRTSRRIPLVRHRRRSAAALESLADFVLHQQRDVTRHLAERARVDATRGDECREAIAMRMPWSVGHREAELFGQCGFHGAALCCRARPACRRRRRTGAPSRLRRPMAQAFQLLLSEPSQPAAFRPNVIGAAG